MAFPLSPGVETKEIDLTTIVPGVGSTEGGFVGNFNWGPIEEIVTVSSESELSDSFGGPDANTFVSYYTSANFLSYARSLRLVRANANSRTAVASSNNLTIKNETDYESNWSSGTGGATYGPWAAKYPGVKGNSLKVSICPSANAFQATHSLTGTGSVGGTTLVLSDIAANDTNRLLSVGDYINVDEQGYVLVTGVSGNTVTMASALSANVAGADIVSKWGYADRFESAPGTSDYVSNRGGSDDEMHVVVIDEDGAFTGTANTVLEKFAFVSKASDAVNFSGISNYYKNQINSKSAYIWWMGHLTGGTNWGSEAAGVTFTEVLSADYSSLANGSDMAPTDGQVITGYNKFKNEDVVNVSLLMTGSWSSTVVTHIINNICEYRKDCIAVLSPPKAAVVNNDGDETTDIIIYRDSLPSSSYAFISDNWKYQFDRFNNVYRWIPDNGDVAGVIARSDFDTDPWMSPAGLNRGHIKNVWRMAWQSNKTDRDDLYRKGINSIVTFPGEGTVLYGDKTMLAKPSAFDRINVRRLFIILRKSISKAARYSLFELNTPFTRAQFVAMVEPFLRDIKGRDGVTDFKVVCDTTNNTPVVIDRNEFVADIYVKPTRSINFIDLRFVAVGTGVSFEEIVR